MRRIQHAEEVWQENIKLRVALEDIQTVTDFTTFHGHLMEGNDAAHQAHRIARNALANEQEGK